jgi:NADPH2 dehydrogenase
VAGLYDPIQIKDVTLDNRIMMSPMCQYLSDDTGQVKMWHKAHYGSRMISKPGLVMIEAASVERRGRLSKQDLGIWSDEQVEGYREIVQFAHEQGVKIGIQLAHAGRKATPEEELVSASALSFKDGDPVPRELLIEEIAVIVREFGEAARRSMEAGFDVIEIHGAHGYLINQFLSPLSNHREDAYGGSEENRCRFALEVIQSVRAAVGEETPLFYRISATEYTPEGLQIEEMKKFSCLLEQNGVDVIDVSTGGNLHNSVRSWPGYQVDFAAQIREVVGIPVIAVGRIENGPMAEEIIRNERADIVAIGRAFLRDPYWAYTAARELGIERKQPNF